MDAQNFFELLVSSLEREEKDLRNIQEDRGDDKTPRISVRNYYERWLGCCIYKEAIREGVVERIDFEKGRVDFCLLDSNKKPSVAVELKGPFDVGEDAKVKGFWVKEIQADFKKQFDREKLQECEDRFIVLLPWGVNEMVENWIKGQLFSDILPQLREVSNPEEFSEQLALNNGKTMKILMYRVSPLGR